MATVQRFTFCIGRQTARLQVGPPGLRRAAPDRRGAWWAWGGISRSVAVVATGDARIVWQHIRSEPDLATGTATVFVRYRLANAGSGPFAATLDGSIEGTAATIHAPVTIPAQGTIEVDAQVTLSKEAVRLWHFDHPNLYRLTTTLGSAAGLLHRASDRFGIRKVELVRDGLLLNGERVRLCGLNRVSDSSATGATEPDALVRQDVTLMKQANANLCRLMHVAQAPNLLDLLDEKGMLIWAEIPVWGEGDPQVKDSQSRLPEQWMRETIERDYNHPCIIGWSVGNELKNHFDYVKRMLEFTRGLDPHRIATHVSFTCFSGKLDVARDPTSISPITMPNVYGMGTAGATERMHQRWPNQPIFFTEFGMSQFGNALESRIDKLEDMFHRAVDGHSSVIGVSLWTYNDYRSDYKGTPVSGFRAWGIVDDARRPKAAYAQVRALFSPVHGLSRQGNRVEVVPRSPEEIPSFTLRGYRLAWDGGGVDLPELAPGAATWSTVVSAPPGVEIRLMTPTGFDVASCR